MITFVTAFIKPTTNYRSVDKYFYFFHFLANSGISIILYLDRCFKDTPEENTIKEKFKNVFIVPEYISIYDATNFLYNFTTEKYKGKEDNIQLPCNRNQNKDTLEYMCIQLMKLKYVNDAQKYSTSSYLAWIDFGIFHMFNNIQTIYDKLKNIVKIASDKTISFCNDKIIAPSPGYYNNKQLFETICWYFCGSFFLGNRNLFQNAYDRQFEIVKSYLPLITWEINYWYLMRDHFIIYTGNHDDTIFNIPLEKPFVTKKYHYPLIPLVL
jgi:hypothetical protein